MNYIIKNDNDCYVKLNEHGGVNFTQNKKKDYNKIKEIRYDKPSSSFCKSSYRAG